MNELTFRITFATPFRVSSGEAAPGVDNTVDLTDPLPSSSLKGVMRATALDLGLPEEVVGSVFGDTTRPSPWAWTAAVPVDGDEWATPQVATRVALDEHHSAAHDMLGMAEETAAGAATFTVDLQASLPADIVELHRAVLAVAGQATRSLGGGRRRGSGWVQIRCLAPTVTRSHVDLVLGARR